MPLSMPQSSARHNDYNRQELRKLTCEAQLQQGATPVSRKVSLHWPSQPPGHKRCDEQQHPGDTPAQHLGWLM